MKSTLPFIHWSNIHDNDYIMMPYTVGAGQVFRPIPGSPSRSRALVGRITQASFAALKARRKMDWTGTHTGEQTARVLPLCANCHAQLPTKGGEYCEGCARNRPASIARINSTPSDPIPPKTSAQHGAPKTKLVWDKPTAGLTNPETITGATGKPVKMDANNWPKGTESWAEPSAPIDNRQSVTRSQFVITALHAGFIIEDTYGTTPEGCERCDIQLNGKQDGSTLRFIAQFANADTIDQYTMSHDKIMRLRVAFTAQPETFAKPSPVLPTYHEITGKPFRIAQHLPPCCINHSSAEVLAEECTRPVILPGYRDLEQSRPSKPLPFSHERQVRCLGTLATDAGKPMDSTAQFIRISDHVTARERRELMVCTDCLMIIANDDDSGMDDKQAENTRQGITDWRNEDFYLCAGDSEKDEEFSTIGCQCCRSRLYGSRHQVVAMLHAPTATVR